MTRAGEFDMPVFPFVGGESQPETAVRPARRTFTRAGRYSFEATAYNHARRPRKFHKGKVSGGRKAEGGRQ
jgi:hypothetical protein